MTCVCVCVCRGLVYASAVRRAAGMVRETPAGVSELPNAERVAEEGVPASHHHPEFRPWKGPNFLPSPLVFVSSFPGPFGFSSHGSSQPAIKLSIGECVPSSYPSQLNGIYLINHLKISAFVVCFPHGWSHLLCWWI